MEGAHFRVTLPVLVKTNLSFMLKEKQRPKEIMNCEL